MPGHGYTDIPCAGFGGKPMRIQGGHKYERRKPGGPLARRGERHHTTGTNLHQLHLAALAPLFGVELDGSGAPSQFTGPLPGLVG